MAHTFSNLTAKTKLLFLYAALSAAVTIVLAGTLSPVSAYAATPTTLVGDITQNKSGDGKEVVLFDGTKYLVDNNGTLEWKADTDAVFDMAKATFTLRYDTTSSGMDYKNQGVLGDSDPKVTADHYNIIGASGKHLTMGNENANAAGNITLSLRDEAFLNPTPGTVDYRVNAVGSSLVPIGWHGYKVYSDRFSSTGDLAWFALNADDFTQSVILTKPITGATVDGAGGISVYEVPSYTVTYVDYDGTVLKGPDTVNIGDSEPAAPADPTRESDDEYDYTFDKWEKSTDDAGNVTYTATYDAAPRPKPTTPSPSPTTSAPTPTPTATETPTSTPSPSPTSASPTATETPTPSPSPTTASPSSTPTSDSSTATITVTDDNGDPIEGATVMVVCDGEEVVSYETTGADKVVELSGEQCTVYVDVPEGYELVDEVTITPKPGDQDVEIVAAKLQDVTVTIVDGKTGEVIDGLVDIYDSEGKNVVATVKSGDSVKLPKGDYTAKQSGDISGYTKAEDTTFAVADEAQTVILTIQEKPSTVVINVTDKLNHEPVDVSAKIVCGQVTQNVMSQKGTLVFNADAGTCTVTLSASGFESATLTLEIPGKGQQVTRDVELTPLSITRGAEITGNGNGNGDALNNAVLEDPTAAAAPSDNASANDRPALPRTGVSVGLGVAVAAILVLAGIVLVVKRRSER